MDPRDRADALLARARARHGYVVTPEDAVSPMDAANTQQIPRAVVGAADHLSEAETTASIPAPMARGERGERTDRVDRVDRAPQTTQPVPSQLIRRPTGPRAGRQERQDRNKPLNPQYSSASQEPVWPTERDQPASSAKHPPSAKQARQERAVDGIVPTVQQPPPDNQSTLSQRLDGS